MRIMEQGSLDWLEWRRQGLGASDAPIVLGVSPYKTPYQLWLEKTKRAESFKGNWATQRGHALEPIARASYELEHDADMPPLLAVYEKASFIRASLDGYNAKLSRVLEIKCPGKKDHDLALAGKVPEKYYPQVQHQLLVTGASECHYYSFDGHSGVTVIVKPDAEFIVKLYSKLCEFWDYIKKDTPPPFSEGDYVKITDQKIEQAIDAYIKAKKQLDAYKLEYDLAYDALKSLMTHDRTECGAARMLFIERKGAIDYSRVPQLKDIDLEAYRKKPVRVFQIFPKK